MSTTGVQFDDSDDAQTIAEVIPNVTDQVQLEAHVVDAERDDVVFNASTAIYHNLVVRGGAANGFLNVQKILSAASHTVVMMWIYAGAGAYARVCIRCWMWFVRKRG